MKWLWLIGLTAGLSANAAVLETRLAAVEEPEGRQRGVMVLAEEEGHVLWADERDAVLVAALKEAEAQGRALRIEYRAGAKKRIVGVELLAEDPFTKEHDPTDPTPTEPEEAVAYTPSVLSSSQAQSAFFSMDRRTKSSSQCYNRAHGWAYDMWRTRGIYSEKLFLFFTRKYIRAYNYHWWFHVVPMVQVSGIGSQPMDRSYAGGPRNVRTWTNIFMHNNAECPFVSKYSDYRNHQFEQWCYLIRRPMYFRQPLDIRRQEQTGRVKTSFLTWEVRQARRQAFIHWRSYNP